MNAELAEHISALAAPIYAALFAQASPPEARDPAWRAKTMATAIMLARELWDAALAA